MNAAIQAYCEADAKLTWRLFQQQAWWDWLARKIRRTERQFLEDGIVLLSLHDDSHIWEPRP